jgi:hypothetical protein
VRRLDRPRDKACEPMSDIDRTWASNSDELVTQQAIRRFENLPRILWPGLPADMISKKMVDQGCRFTWDVREQRENRLYRYGGVECCGDLWMRSSSLIADSFSCGTVTRRSAGRHCVAVLRSRGSHDLRLRGNATESGNQMSVAAMWHVTEDGFRIGELKALQCEANPYTP